jgi:FkbM family methyltransferase
MMLGGMDRVVPVEANPAALAISAENLIWNGLSNRAVFVPAFAGDSDGSTQEFWTVGTGAAGSMHRSHADTTRRRGTKITVPTVILDSPCTHFGRPDLVKIDIEGVEAGVLSGCSQCAEQGASRFIVEMHSNPELSMWANAELVLDWRDRHAMAAWYLKEHRPLTEPSANEKRGRCHLLLQPATWPYPDWLANVHQGSSLDAVATQPPSSAPHSSHHHLSRNLI